MAGQCVAMSFSHRNRCETGTYRCRPTAAMLPKRRTGKGRLQESLALSSFCSFFWCQSIVTVSFAGLHVSRLIPANMPVTGEKPVQVKKQVWV